MEECSQLCKNIVSILKEKQIIQYFTFIKINIISSDLESVSYDNNFFFSNKQNSGYIDDFTIIPIY